MRARSACLSLIATAALILVAAAVAVAHAELESADPPPTSTLPASPAEVRLAFSEPVDSGNLVVTLVARDSGAAVPVPEPTVSNSGRRVVVVPPELDAGVYLVHYRAVSAIDGHVVAGEYAFQVDPDGTAPPLRDTTVSSTENAGLPTVLARWIAQAAALAVFGTAVFWSLSGRPALRERSLATDRLGVWRLMAAAAFLSFAGLGIFLAFAAAGVGTTPAGTPHQHFPIDFAGPFGWTPFAIAMRTVEGAAFGALALSTAWFTARLDYRRARTDRPPGTRLPPGWSADGIALAVMLALGGVALGGYSFGGHAAAEGGALSALVDWGHQLSVGVWLGTLPALLLFLAVYVRGTAHGGRTPLAMAALARHSRVALVAGPLVALTGIANSSLLIGNSRDLISTDYGGYVLGKVLLFSVAVALGSVNFFLLRAMRPANVTRLVAVELGVGTLAVLLAVRLVTLQPPTDSAAATARAEAPAHLVGQTEGTLIHAILTPGGGGTDAADIAMLDPSDGTYLTDVEAVTLRPRPISGSSTPTAVDAVESPSQPGLFRARLAAPSTSSNWLLDVTFTRTAAEVTATLEVPAPSTLAPVASSPGAGSLVFPVAPFAGLIPFWLSVAAAVVSFAVAAVAFAAELRGIGRARTSLGLLRGIRTAAVVIGVAAALVTGSYLLVRAANAAPASAQGAANPVTADATSIDRGRQAYAANCLACHGTPDALRAGVAGTSDADVFFVVTNGIVGTEMPAFATVLSEVERWDVVNYLRDGSTP
ncbi:MAG: copper resistance protein CopC [Candidatus Limnocylindria bacterium]